MLRIDLTPYDSGTHHLVLSPEADDLDLDPAQFADLRVDLVLDYHDDRALVSLEASAVATLQCDRTLVFFEQPIEGAYRILFARPAIRDARPHEAGEEALEEVRTLDPSDRRIDLTEAVRDTLLLAVPVRKVAPGAEDEPIPTVFGAPTGDEAQIDPRWEALRQLRSEDDLS